MQQHSNKPEIKLTGIKQVDSHNSEHSPSKDHQHEHHHHHSKSKNLRRFFLRIAHSNSYVAIPIIAVASATYLNIGSFDFNWNYLLFLFFSTLMLYPLHRLVGIKMTIPVEFTKAQRAVDSHPFLAQSAVIIGLIGTVYFTWNLDIYTVQLLAPLGIISITYSVPIIPTLNGWKRLRDIQGIKIFAISLVVSFTTSTIPLLLLETVSNTDVFFLGAQRFFFILAVTIPFDVRDAVIDKRWDLKTIPLVLGNAKAITLSVVLVNFTTILALIQFLVTGIFGFEIVIALLLSNLWTTFILLKFRENNSPLYNAFIVEGTMVVQFAIVTITVVSLTLF